MRFNADYKTTSTIAPIAFTKDEIESDVDRHLNAERFTEVTFNAENDSVSNITDYSLYCVIWNGTALPARAPIAV